MPCRNAGPFLREAVASVLRQPQRLELLVADGGSSDGSLQLLEELASADPRLRVASRSHSASTRPSAPPAAA
jgi:glycosyltransferase involved in cell wall biosynthesis